MTDMDPAWKSCWAGTGMGIDPFIVASPVETPSDFTAGPPLRKRLHKGRLEHGHSHEHAAITPKAVAAVTTATTG